MKLRAIYSVLLISALAGCSSQPSQFYVLNEIPPSDAHKLYVKNYHNLGLGPVSFPRYLNQPQIVTRETCNKLILNEFHRWAESLDDNSTHVIRNNLSNMLPASNIFIYPWRHADKVEYQIRIEVTRFDADEKGHVVLATQWQIVNDFDKKILRTSNRTYRESIGEKYTYDDLAGTMSLLLGRFTKDIAHSVVSVSVHNTHVDKEVKTEKIALIQVNYFYFH